MHIATTPRLALRHFEATNTDRDFIFELLNSPSWLQFIGNRAVETPAKAGIYLQTNLIDSYTTKGFGLYAVVHQSEKKLIGMAGFVKREALPSVDVGFAFLAAYEGKGYALEATQAALHYGKTTLGLEKIYAVINHDNQKSINLITKVGFVPSSSIQIIVGEVPVLVFENDAHN